MDVVPVLVAVEVEAEVPKEVNEGLERSGEKKLGRCGSLDGEKSTSALGDALNMGRDGVRRVSRDGESSVTDVSVLDRPSMR
jgi:hypothetical protein